MSFHLLGYTVATGGASTNQDTPAYTDPEFTQQSSHYVFTEPWNILALYAMGATLTDMRLNVPHINMYARHHVWPQTRSLTVPSNPAIDDYREYPIQLPLNEQVAMENTDTASETVTGYMWIGDNGWSKRVSKGMQRLTVLCTQNVTTVANTFAGLAALAFAESLRGGVYAVNGAECFAAATTAFRLVFPRKALTYGKRRTRPGHLAQQARGDVPALRWWRSGWGEWGRFHTFEPPQIEASANASATVSHVVALDVTYLGEDQSLLDQAA